MSFHREWLIAEGTSAGKLNIALRRKAGPRGAVVLSSLRSLRDAWGMWAASSRWAAQTFRSFGSSISLLLGLQGKQPQRLHISPKCVFVNERVKDSLTPLSHCYLRESNHIFRNLNVSCKGPDSSVAHLSAPLSWDSLWGWEVTVPGEAVTAVGLCRAFEGSVTFIHQAQGKVRPPGFKDFQAGYLLFSSSK